MVVIYTINTDTNGRNSISKVSAEAKIDTGETGTDMIGGQVQKMYSGEEIGVFTEVIGKYPTSHIPKTDSGAGKTPTVMEVSQSERGLCGGRRYGECGVDGPEKNMRGW